MAPGAGMTRVALTGQSIAGYLFSHWDIDGIAQGNDVNPATIRTTVPHTTTAHYAAIHEPFCVGVMAAIMAIDAHRRSRIHRLT